MRAGGGNGAGRRCNLHLTLALLINLALISWLVMHQCSTSVYIDNIDQDAVTFEANEEGDKFQIRLKDHKGESGYGQGRPQSWMEQKEAEMEERRGRVRQVCEERGENLKWVRTLRNKFWLVDKDHGLAYCRIPKVSTTTLIRHFLELSDLPDGIKSEWKEQLRSLHDRVATMFLLKKEEMDNLDEINDMVEQYDLHPFVFVRHPFERIVSAYEDKMVENKPAHYRKLIQQIGSTFPNFVDYIIDSVDRAISNGCNMRKGSCPVIDQHFSPYYSWCAFCDIPYQTIGKAETFDEDFQYLIEKTGLQDILKVDTVRMHSTNHGQDKAKSYFNELSQQQKKRLYEIYRLDFIMFGYNAEEYLNL